MCGLRYESRIYLLRIYSCIYSLLLYVGSMRAIIHMRQIEKKMLQKLGSVCSTNRDFIYFFISFPSFTVFRPPPPLPPPPQNRSSAGGNRALNRFYYFLFVSPASPCTSFDPLLAAMRQPIDSIPPKSNSILFPFYSILLYSIQFDVHYFSSPARL